MGEYRYSGCACCNTGCCVDVPDTLCLTITGGNSCLAGPHTMTKTGDVWTTGTVGGADWCDPTDTYNGGIVTLGCTGGVWYLDADDGADCWTFGNYDGRFFLVTSSTCSPFQVVATGAVSGAAGCGSGPITLTVAPCMAMRMTADTSERDQIRNALGISPDYQFGGREVTPMTAVKPKKGCGCGKTGKTRL